MKKILLIAGVFTTTSSFALNDLNLDKQIVTCQGESGSSYTLNSKSTASDIVTNCKITGQQTGHYALWKGTTVEFNATVTTPVTCDYHNDKLDDCKFVK